MQQEAVQERREHSSAADGLPLPHGSQWEPKVTIQPAKHG